MLLPPTPPAAPPRPPVRSGDAVYLTLQVPDSARARDFYEAVLDWTAVPGRVADGWQVEGPTPMVGIGGGAERGETGPVYAVDDIEVAVLAVQAARGPARGGGPPPPRRPAPWRRDPGLPVF